MKIFSNNTVSPFFFLDLDTQVDFMEKKGANFIKSAPAIRPNLCLLTEHARRQHIPLIASVEAYEESDWQSDAHLSQKKGLIKAKKEGQRILPDLHSLKKPFGVKASHGFEKIPETSIPKALVLPFSKKDHRSAKKLLTAGNDPSFFKRFPQIIVESQGFDLFSNALTVPLLKLLKKRKIETCFVYGMGLDYGIEAAVIRLLEHGFQVRIVVDATGCIHEANRERVLIELRKQGAQMWNTAFAIAKS